MESAAALQPSGRRPCHRPESGNPVRGRGGGKVAEDTFPVELSRTTLTPRGRVLMGLRGWGTLFPRLSTEEKEQENLLEVCLVLARMLTGFFEL